MTFPRLFAGAGALMLALTVSFGLIMWSLDLVSEPDMRLVTIHYVGR